jgi:hypothetical protein
MTTACQTEAASSSAAFADVFYAVDDVSGVFYRIHDATHLPSEIFLIDTANFEAGAVLNVVAGQDDGVERLSQFVEQTRDPLPVFSVLVHVLALV